MKYVWLVALREYAENAKTKGFWLGILMLPIMLFAGLKIPTLLNEQVSTRYFVLVDQSGQYEKSIQAAIEASHQNRVAKEKEHWTGSAIDAAHKDIEPLEDAIEKKLGKDIRLAFEETTKKSIIAAIVRGRNELKPEDMASMSKVPKDKQMELSMVAMDWYSRAIAIGEKKIKKFEEPRRRFKQIDAPADTKPDALVVETGDSEGDAAKSTNDGIGSFRPYISGEKKISVEDKKENLFALVIIPANITNVKQAQVFKGAEYWCSNLTDADLKEEIERALENEIHKRMFEKSGITPDAVSSIQKTSVALAGKDPKKAAGSEKVTDEDTIRQWAPVGAVYLLWVAIFTVAQMLLNNTTEEKQSRVIEVLLSSVTPTELMFGKLIGIAAVGLTMVGAWIGSFIFILKSGMAVDSKFITALTDVIGTPELLLAFAGYFVLGYLLYAGAFLAVGAVVNTLKEAQNLMAPIMLVMSVPLFTMVFIAKEPNGTLAKVLSWVPLYTPFVMMNRAAASPPMADVVGTLILLFLSVVFSIWFSGKIFRIGILRTGQPPKFMELLGWLVKKST
ncbi:MAG: ABC transporter permease [Planctomycetes bacterium]|nr:ABC transporter permease [Planctomycetota bacterium]